MKRAVRVLLLILGVVLLCCVGSFALAQAIPYGRNHQNPPVGLEPAWDSPQTRALAKRACFDCHSNETNWPWYSSIAPISWLVQNHVDEGRRRLNFSDINGTQNTGGGEGEGFSSGNRRFNEIGRVIQDGSMPPWDYILQHPSSALSDQEKQQLIQGLQTTLGSQ